MRGGLVVRSLIGTAFRRWVANSKLAFAKARIVTNRPKQKKRLSLILPTGDKHSLQPLHLTIDECGKIITDSLKDTEIPPEIADEVQQLKLPEHRSLALALWLFERFHIYSDRGKRVAQSEKILTAVLANVSDSAWKDEFEQIIADNSEKSFFRFWMLRNLLVIFDQSTMALGNRLTKQFPVSEDEIVAAFVNLETKHDSIH